jgi:hypothetical protein
MNYMMLRATSTAQAVPRARSAVAQTLSGSDAAVTLRRSQPRHSSGLITRARTPSRFSHTRWFEQRSQTRRDHLKDPGAAERACFSTRDSAVGMPDVNVDAVVDGRHAIELFGRGSERALGRLRNRWPALAQGPSQESPKTICIPSST